jgi:hypothetical protein
MEVIREEQYQSLIQQVEEMIKSIQTNKTLGLPQQDTFWYRQKLEELHIIRENLEAAQIRAIELEKLSELTFHEISLKLKSSKESIV